MADEDRTKTWDREGIQVEIRGQIVNYVRHVVGRKIGCLLTIRDFPGGGAHRGDAMMSADTLSNRSLAAFAFSFPPKKGPFWCQIYSPEEKFVCFDN